MGDLDLFMTPLSTIHSALQMQAFVQQMLHSEHGVPIRSHKRRLISAIPSVFTGNYHHVSSLCVLLSVVSWSCNFEWLSQHCCHKPSLLMKTEAFSWMSAKFPLLSWYQRTLFYIQSYCLLQWATVSFTNLGDHCTWTRILAVKSSCHGAIGPTPEKQHTSNVQKLCAEASFEFQLILSLNVQTILGGG